MSIRRQTQSRGHKMSGGGGGIRTPETLTGLTVFKTAGFNRSPTPPQFRLQVASGMVKAAGNLRAQMCSSSRGSVALSGR